MILPVDYDYDEETISYMYYEEERNLFFYDGGYMCYNIYSIMTPNDVYLFKLGREDILVRTKLGDIYWVSYEMAMDDEDEVWPNFA
jgi:hypothetical protein